MVHNVTEKIHYIFVGNGKEVSYRVVLPVPNTIFASDS